MDSAINVKSILSCCHKNGKKSNISADRSFLVHSCPPSVSWRILGKHRNTCSDHGTKEKSACGSDIRFEIAIYSCFDRYFFSIEASEIATDKLNPIKDIALQSPAIRMFRSAASKNTLFQKSFGPISLRLEVDLDENQVEVIFGKCGRMANARKEVPIDTFGRIFERVVEYRGI